MENTWHKSIIDLVTRVNGKQVTQGSTPCYLPSLDMVAEGLPAPDKTEHDEAGKVTLIYNDENLAYLQAALTSKVEGSVRSAITWNKEGEVPTYSGQAKDAAQDWDTLLEAANTGQYFVTRKQWLAGFKAFLAQASGLPELGQSQLYSFVILEKGLASHDQSMRTKIAGYVMSYIESLPEETRDEVAVYTNKMVSYLEGGVATVEDIAF